MRLSRWLFAALVMPACSLTGCASVPKDRAVDFAVRTTPAGAAVETTRGYRCTTPCRVPLDPHGSVTTVTMLGYKPVQIPAAAGRSPGSIDVKLVPQDPGAGAPDPTRGK